MRQITGIIVHCAATRPGWMEGQPLSAKVNRIRHWHVNERGWSDIGYHFIVDRDGSSQGGRPIERDGAHTRGHNKGTIGICLLGGHGSAETDAFLDNFTHAQNSSLRALIENLRRAYGSHLPVTGHNQYAAKACPGFNVPKWLANENIETPLPDALMSDSEKRLRWRLAEIIKAGQDALSGE